MSTTSPQTVLLSSRTDPFANLALEEWLLRHGDPDAFALLLYRNGPAVVVGRNQNPWLECDVGSLPGLGVALARRVSGGGTVYHDAGNLNVTLVGPRRLYRPDRHLELIRAGLARLGIAADPGQRHGLFVAGRKVSGSAFMLTGQRALQHATVLVDADLARLRQCLQVRRRTIETHAQPSVPAAVTNLVAVRPGLTSEDVGAALVQAAAAADAPGGRPASPVVRPVDWADLSTRPGFDALLVRYRAWEWVYGRTPAFVHRAVGCPAGRPTEVELVVEAGLVADLRLPVWPWGDAAAQALMRGCRGRPYPDPLTARGLGARLAQGAAGPAAGALGDWLAGELGGTAAPGEGGG